MHLLFVSDIHGNFFAYRELIKAIDNSPYTYDEIICLGDVAGYYPTFHLLWEQIESFVKHESFRPGNHDIAFARWHSAEKLPLNEVAIMGIAAQRMKIKKDDPQRLTHIENLFAPPEKQEPYLLERNGKRFVLVHGCPDGYDPQCMPETERDLNSFNSIYLSCQRHDSSLKRAMQYVYDRYGDSSAMPIHLLFGHSHLPTFTYLSGENQITLGSLYTYPDIDNPVSLQRLKVNNDIDVIAINPGSVGQPRDGVVVPSNDEARLHAMLFDTEEDSIRFFTTTYRYSGLDFAIKDVSFKNLLADDVKELTQLHHFMKQVYADSSSKTLVPESEFRFSGLEKKFADLQSLRNWFYQADPQDNSDRSTLLDVYDQVWQLHVSKKLMDWLIRPQRQLSHDKYCYQYEHAQFKLK